MEHNDQITTNNNITEATTTSCGFSTVISCTAHIGGFDDFHMPHEQLASASGDDYWRRRSISLGLADIFNGPSRSSTFDDLFQNMTTFDCNNSVTDPLGSEFQAAQPLSSPAVVVGTPSSFSVSSSSTEAAALDRISKNDELVAEEETDELNEESRTDKTFVQKLKPRKKTLKKHREARFAFMTKSDTDHLDDGYRWRKYGQKSVKNSPFPRSYYRCISRACGVKKRVERSPEDSSIIVTSYEGTHTHPLPVAPRGSFGILPETTTTTSYGGGGIIDSASGASSSHFAINTQMLRHHNSCDHYHQHYRGNIVAAGVHQINQQAYFGNLTPQLSAFSGISSNAISIDPTLSLTLHQEMKPSSAGTYSIERDHGLLQDMLPSQMLLKEKDAKEDLNI